MVSRNAEVFGSAICNYTYTSLEAAFNGTFLAEDSDKQWKEVPQAEVPDERPEWVNILFATVSSVIFFWFVPSQKGTIAK